MKDRALNFRFVAIAIAAWGLASCLTGCSGGTIVKVESNPIEADVYAGRLGGSPPRLVGKTPLEARLKELEPTLEGAGPLWLELRKTGYRNSGTLISDLSATDVTLKLDLLAQNPAEDLERLNHALDQLFEAQKVAKLGRLDESLGILQKIRQEVPEVAAVYEMEGAIYYLKKDLKKAFESYQLAVKYNGKNPESIRMRNFLESKLGMGGRRGSARLPAASTGSRAQEKGVKAP